MHPFCTYIFTKLAVVVTLLFCSYFLKDGIVLVANISTSLPKTERERPELDAKNAALKEMMVYEKDMAQKNLRNMDLVLKQNSDPLPDRDNSLTAVKICNRTGNCIPKYLPLETRVRTAPAHKMLNCIVQKSMSTVMTALMCFLYDEAAFLEKKREFMMEWSKYRRESKTGRDVTMMDINGYRNQRFCKDKNEYNRVTTAADELNIGNGKGWSLSMVTRDPVERFISGFVDRCLRKPLPPTPCNGCGVNLTCFVESEYARMLNQVKTGNIERSFEDVHFFPQNWRCELSKYYNQFEFIKYSSNDPQGFIEQVSKIAARQNVSKSSLDFLRSQISTGKTIHVTSDSPTRKYLEKRLRSSSYLMEYVVRMFYHDFLLFNYPFPEGF